MTDNALATTAPVDLAPRETATAQATSMARSQTEAQYLVAERHPRNMDLVRQKLLTECERTGFAETAIYSVPRGRKKIEGLSIRFAEGARRLYGNMLTQDAIIYEDDLQQIMRVTAIDFETNSVAISDVSVPKFVEKRSPRDGDEVIGSRTNSTGQTTYKVRATDDDMRMKRNSEAARARRNRILELIPADLREECMKRCRGTMAAGAKKDPDAFRRGIVDGFALQRVPADELSEYLGHDLGTASPEELTELRVVYQTVKDGEATWHECLAAKTGVVSDGEDDPHADLKAKVRDRVAASKKRKPKSGKGKKRPEGAVAPGDEPSDEDLRQPGDDG